MIVKTLSLIWKLIGIIIILFGAYSFYLINFYQTVSQGFGGALGFAISIIAIGIWLGITLIILFVRWII